MMPVVFSSLLREIISQNEVSSPKYASISAKDIQIVIRCHKRCAIVLSSRGVYMESCFSNELKSPRLKYNHIN